MLATRGPGDTRPVQSGSVALATAVATAAAATRAATGAAFADRAFRAIEAGTSYQVIPWQMGVVAKLLRLLPNAWFDRALAGRPRKARQRDH